MATVTAVQRAQQDGRGVKPEAGPARFVSEPAALGLAGFALTTMMLSFINTGIVSDKAAPVVLGAAFAYGGVVQLLAGMWAFIKNDTFAAVALSSYGGFWISFYLLESQFAKQIPAGEVNDALALYLICWGVFSFYMWVASFRVSWAINLVFLTLWPAYGLMGIGKAIDSTGLFHLGGVFGIATAAAAWYASAAIVLNKAFERDVLPVGELRSVQQDVGQT
jgi:succinate-acetate transporter protein